MIWKEQCLPYKCVFFWRNLYILITVFTTETLLFIQEGYNMVVTFYGFSKNIIFLWHNLANIICLLTGTLIINMNTKERTSLKQTYCDSWFAQCAVLGSRFIDFLTDWETGKINNFSNILWGQPINRKSTKK